MPMLTTTGGETRKPPARDEGPRMVNMKQVVFMTGLSRATIYRHMEKGTFPPSTYITDHRIGWPYHEIIEWMESLPRRKVVTEH